MKKLLILALIFILCLFSGCGYLANTQYFDNYNDYPNIWTLTGFRHGYEKKSPLFPNEITDLDVCEFFCRYDEQFPLGEGVQIYLEVTYVGKDFDKEVKRISNISNKNIHNFKTTDIIAYDIKLGEDGCWEYALINPNLKKIYYIFIYNLPKSEIEFNHNFVPDNYIDYIQ